MKSMFYGKVGKGMAKAGTVFVILTMIFTFLSGLIIPDNIVISFYISSFILIIAAIVIALIGILNDESRLEAIEALIWGIILLVGVSFLLIFYIIYM